MGQRECGQINPLSPVRQSSMGISTSCLHCTPGEVLGLQSKTLYGLIRERWYQPSSSSDALSGLTQKASLSSLFLFHTSTGQVIRAAWDAITEEQLQERIAEMPARCQAVIQAGGGYTRY
ncbi:hypothetical protein ACJ73_07784 [Blastomyces percursus]|uniref:Uncharacterized protein n=1 Tax=Blastomyces percursus TaxID=1658174 RepID=A0A1J9QXF8_9EURO|nr:hypothetical protein ACJ73_07784 [Blastomyces percursus]